MPVSIKTGTNERTIKGITGLPLSLKHHVASHFKKGSTLTVGDFL